MANCGRIFLGFAQLQAGSLDDALSTLQTATEYTDAIGLMAFHPISLVYRSEAYLRSGDLEKASALAQRATQLTREYQQGTYQPWALRMLGEVAAHPSRFNADAAEAHYCEAMQLAEDLGMRPLKAHCHAGLARLYGRSRNRQQAEDHFARAALLYRDMGMTFWLKRAEADAKER